LTARPWRLKGGEEVGYDGSKHRKGAKIHAIVNECSKPMAVAISPGDTHDSKTFKHVYAKMENRPNKLHGDSAYNAEEIKSKLKEDGVQANIQQTLGTGESRYHTMSEDVR
jgi:hypothetical protein